MGILFARIWRLFNHQEHKVIIVGLDNAGKTTILYQFSMNEVVHTSPTIGSNVEEIVVNNTRFLMWDIGGQESLRSSWNTYYTNTEFVIVVVDSTDRERISVTKEELYKMLAHEVGSKVLKNSSLKHNELLRGEIVPRTGMDDVKT
ncbi:ADP-ribosylation factor-like protein 5A isoform X2 [Podarcis muralis]|uniref:ADP-ribosylation factor-like protein 5A isoform X3 n=1 Tax=Podarcis muralis TaxID=64176 RepID=UPI0010A0810C|nr:ADP-ribosylation factor-like protein 5A isoform X3 [Podarcis muralis]XP_053262957.1 ADP-ribosylation factor-like protein 5A isoform X3 [Podarcis raffonei]